jgi:hypothetical protein
MRLSVLLERTSVRSVRKIMQRYKKNPTFASFVVIFLINAISNMHIYVHLRGVWQMKF